MPSQPPALASPFTVCPGNLETLPPLWARTTEQVTPRAVTPSGAPPPPCPQQIPGGSFAHPRRKEHPPRPPTNPQAPPGKMRYTHQSGSMGQALSHNFPLFSTTASGAVMCFSPFLIRLPRQKTLLQWYTSRSLRTGETAFLLSMVLVPLLLPFKPVACRSPFMCPLPYSKRQ